MASFSRVGAYNQITTGRLIICQFDKSVHLISAVIAAVYKNVLNLAPVSMSSLGAAYKRGRQCFRLPTVVYVQTRKAASNHPTVLPSPRQLGGGLCRRSAAGAMASRRSILMSNCINLLLSV